MMTFGLMPSAGTVAWLFYPTLMDDDKPRGAGFSYLTIVVMAILAAWFYLRPLGLQIRRVLQSLFGAFGSR